MDKPNNVHLRNILRLWYPVLWMIGLSVTFMAIGYIYQDFYGNMAWVMYGISMLAALTTFPWAVYCAARHLEYDRLITEIARSGVLNILSGKVDAWANRLCAIPGRKLVLALGLMTLKHPPASVGEALATIDMSGQSMPNSFKKLKSARAKRLPPAKIFTKEWWTACFTPAQLV